MHLPYIVSFAAPEAKLIPIMVGNMNESNLKKFTSALLPYFEMEDSLFLVSSDFCHWGRNFDYTPLEEGTPEKDIHKYIEKLDRRAMKLIEEQDLRGLTSYFR